MRSSSWSKFAEDRVLVEQLRLIYASTTITVLPMFPAIALLIWVLISPSNRAGLLGWVVVVSLTNLYWIFNARHSLAHGLAEHDAHRLARWLIVCIVAGGASWGALAFGALGNTTAAGEIMAIFVLSGILSGSVALLAPVLPLYIAFSVPLVGLTVSHW